MTVNMDLDIAFGANETLTDAVLDLLAQAYDANERQGVSWVIADESGPGGGWPVVRFSAAHGQELWPLALAYADGDEDEASMFCNRQYVD